MSKIWNGDEWKYCDNGKEPEPTRAQEQSRIDVEYCNGRMERSEWLTRTDELSDVSKWVSTGKVKEKKNA